MPSVPGFLADLVEWNFGTPVGVISNALLAPTLRRVRFQSRELARAYAAGKVGPGLWTVEFRTGRKDMRHYTPCNWDFDSGAFDVLFFRHGEGPGRDWADRLRPGDEVRALGPGSRVAIEAGRDHVVIGDETSLGNALAVIAGAGRARVSGVIACTAQSEALPAAVGLSLQVVAGESETERARLAIAQLQASDVNETAKYHLTGSRELVSETGRFLMKSVGVPRSSIHLRVHWDAGRPGL
ncbi:MAG: siderophore-interacting protein [Alphaproteobacteria bacterium]|nr:siderophore-interacting protein [Alphaproteobacteria bacterium]